jgi:HEAT repeat protein
MRRSYRDATFGILVLLLLIRLALQQFATGQQLDSTAKLVEEFKNERVFWKQFEVAKKIVSLRDPRLLHELEPSLNDDDRHVRGNAAFVFAAMGHDRGFGCIETILRDRSVRPKGQSTAGNWSATAQIVSDRYYAAHLFGDLKDARAVPILIPLLNDPEVNWIVPWSLAEIGDRSAVPPLIQTLSDKSPDMRVLAIYALEKLRAKEALPQLRLLLSDNERIHFDGLGTVAEAAKGAIAKLDATP